MRLEFFCHDEGVLFASSVGGNIHSSHIRRRKSSERSHFLKQTGVGDIVEIAPSYVLLRIGRVAPRLIASCYVSMYVYSSSGCAIVKTLGDCLPFDSRLCIISIFVRTHYKALRVLMRCS